MKVRIPLGFAAIVVLAVGVVSGAPAPATPPAAGPGAEYARVDRLEELLLKLTPRVNELDVAAHNLSIPDDGSRHLFGESVTVVDIAPLPAPPLGPGPGLVEKRTWPIEGAPRTGAPATLRWWRPFLDSVAYLTNGHFKIVRGRFLDAAESRYVADVRFDAVARLESGSPVAVEAKLELGFTKQPGPGGAGGPEWRIDTWRTRSFGVQQAAGLLFAEVLERALPDAATLEQARTSLQQEYIVRQMRDPRSPKPGRYFQFQSLNQHPGVAVTDIDRDGHDDIYVMERWGANMLLRNRGDGTFEEIAARVGLDIKDHTSSALFADFDNDGDTDAFLGRTLAPSRYYVNEGGRFVDRSAALVATPLPALVSSVSAVDYDRDGLLDVFLSTYAIDADLQEDFLPPAAQQEIKRRWAAGGHLFRDRPGPPNVLLRNLGDGRFDVAPTSADLAIWRNTFQSTWSDFDSDGDMDVYLANDFAPNNLLRNDGGGRFTDVTAATGTADIGFGMGASWGDYDNDGAQDLYVTNMYSTAGRRITDELGPLAADLVPMARGNSLLRNGRDGFTRVSGLEPPALLVERAGWGWGSQFIDVDNDGWLDIHALSGYYTAPALPEFQPDL